MKPLPRRSGQDNPSSLFTDEEAELIRNRLNTEPLTYRKLAKELHCSPSTLWNLHKNGRYPRK